MNNVIESQKKIIRIVARGKLLMRISYLLLILYLIQTFKKNLYRYRVACFANCIMLPDLIKTKSVWPSLFKDSSR